MSEREPSGKLWNAILQRFVLPFACFSLGFGSSQLLAVQSLRDRVNQNTNDVARVRDDLKREEIESSARDDRMYKWADRMASVSEAILKADAEIVGLFKMQQQFKDK